MNNTWVNDGPKTQNSNSNNNSNNNLIALLSLELLAYECICSFTVESIEVPILRALKAEELMKARHDAYEEEKRARLIKLATEVRQFIANTVFSIFGKHSMCVY